MKLFQLTGKPVGVERITEFLEDNYVCVGYPGIGDLDNSNVDVLGDRLLRTFRYNKQELPEHLAAINTFVHTMQDGDYVLVADGEWVHLGDLGDYFYVEEFDTPEDGRCHRRGVTWLKSLAYTELNSGVQAMLAEGGIVTTYKGPLPSARMDLWITAVSPGGQGEQELLSVDAETLAEALDILKHALRSEDAERRERAAIALLQYVK